MGNQGADDKPTTRDVWMRGLFMFLFIIGFWIGQWLLNILAVVQFLWLLFAREPNQLLARFGTTLVELARRDRNAFSSCATDDKPFPWESVAGRKRAASEPHR